MSDPRAIVDEQATDEGLWFVAQTAPEGYLQAELRRLHEAVESDDGQSKRAILKAVITQAIAELDAEHYESQVGGCSVCLPSRSWPCVTRQVADGLRAALGEGGVMMRDQTHFYGDGCDEEHGQPALGPLVEEDEDLSQCPYFARYARWPGHDPEAVCGFGCVDEPECITCRPSEGWPGEKAHDLRAALGDRA